MHLPRRLNSHRQSEELILASRAAEADRRIRIDASSVQGIFPNGAVPFAAALNGLRQRGYVTEVVGASGECSRTGVFEPHQVATLDRDNKHVTNKVWQYSDEDEAAKLATLFVEVLVDRVRCEEGVVDSINWCLYEVMDNVFQHSRAASGFVMMQLHHDSRRCVLTVSDIGIGIQKSLFLGRNSDGVKLDLDRLRDPSTAIGYALQQGVTAKGRLNQGNGLYGLRRTVELNGGQLNLISGRGEWSLREGVTSSSNRFDRPLLDAENSQGLTVDWQISTARAVRIENALGARPRSSGLLETIEDDLGQYRVDVQEIEAALGSRALGGDLRLRLLNYLQAGADYLVLDFRGVGVISSSFADEVLGKLALDLGENEFRRRVILEGASVTNRGLIDRAIELRLKTGS